MGKYLDNRLKYHTASRIGAQTGYSLAQALDPDGHIVRYDSVWVAPTTEFPMNVSKTTDPKDATDDLVEVFLSGYIPTADTIKVADKKYFSKELDKATSKYVYTEITKFTEIEQSDSGSGEATEIMYAVPANAFEYVGKAVEDRTVNGASVYTSTAYPAVELFYQVPMSGVANSDGADSKGKYQAYEIQEDGARVMNWVAPTAVINPDTTKPVAGFSGIAEANVGGTWTVLQKVPKWALATGTWEFAYISGILTFDPNAVPGDSGTDSSVRFTGFKYIGDTADDKFTTMEGSISGKVDTTTYTTKIGELEGDIADKVDTTEYTTKIGELEGDIDGKVDTTTYTTKIGELEGKINNIQFTWEEEPEVPEVNSDLVTSFKIGESYFGRELTFTVADNSVSNTGTNRWWSAWEGDQALYSLTYGPVSLIDPDAGGMWTLAKTAGTFKWCTTDDNPFTSTNWMYGQTPADWYPSDPVQFYDFVFA